MLTLPESGLIPYGYYQERQVFIRSHEVIGKDTYLIHFTNALSGKSNAWRSAVIRPGFRRTWDGQTESYIPVPSRPTWEEIGIAKRGRVGGVPAFKATIWPPVMPDEAWQYAWLIEAPALTLDAAIDYMVKIVRSLYDIQPSD
jgi:hypothetical protein